MTGDKIGAAAATLWKHWQQRTRIDGLPEESRPADRADSEGAGEDDAPEKEGGRRAGAEKATRLALLLDEEAALTALFMWRHDLYTHGCARFPATPYSRRLRWWNCCLGRFGGWAALRGPIPCETCDALQPVEELRE